MILNITSKQNDKVKQVKKLYRSRFRQQAGVFLAEGIRLVEEMLLHGQIEQLFYSDDLLTSERGKFLLDKAKTLPLEVYHCSKEVFKEICDTSNAQGILAVVKQPDSVEDWDNRPDLDCILIIDRIQDPGNLGTILRTALGVGISGIWLIEGTVDLFNPKVVRASMGAILSIPFTFVTREQALSMCEANNLNLFVTELSGGLSYDQADYGKPLALVVGNEANGVDPFFTKHADQKVYIPLTNQVESLNVSIATAVFLYEIWRQRT